MRPEDRITYLRAIWETFETKAGRRREMSPAEYHIAAKWADRNIPLPVVLRGIADFEGKPWRLEAIERSVDRSVAYWHQAMGRLP